MKFPAPKRLASTLLAAAMTLSAFSLNIAARDVTVKVDGTTLSYTLVQPQIINGRTMVPFRETGNALGMEVDYEESTKTAIFTNDEYTVTHVIGTNAINVNGDEIKYDEDMKSVIIDGRTLVSARMLADAIGCEVDWDGENYVVDIYTGGSLGSSETNTASTGTPQIISAAPNITSATIGDTVVVSIIANSSTYAVRLVDSNGNVYGTTSTYAKSSDDNNIFTINFEVTASSVGTNTMYVYAANSQDVYNAYAEGVFTLTVVAGEPTINDFDVTPSSASVDYGDTVKVNVYTATGASKVYITDPNGTELVSSTTPTLTNGEYRWQLSFTAKTTGYYYIYSQNASGSTVSEKKKITVSASGYDITEVKDFETEVEYGDEVTVVVYTEPGATKVYIVNPSGSTVATTKTYTSSDDSELKWTLSFTAKVAGTYTIYSTDGDDEDKDTFSLTVDGTSGSSSTSSKYAISSITVKGDDDSCSEGGTIYIDDDEEITITVKTGTYVDKVRISGDGTNKYVTSTYDTSSSTYTWKLYIAPDYSDASSNSIKYTITTYDDDGDSRDSVTFTVKFN